MSQVTGTGNTFNLPNYAGDLFTASPTQTPFLSMIGGLTGGKQTDNFEFQTGVVYDLPDAAQPDISETASVTAPAASHIAREQKTNVTQIHQEVIDLTYAKQSNSGRLSGLNTAGQTANPNDEKAFQIQQKLVKIARDIEYSFLNGTYQKTEDGSTSNKTRGMLELCTSDAGTSIDAKGAALSKDLFDQLFREMADNGASFGNMVLFCNSYIKQAITNLYADFFKAQMQMTENIAGMNIVQIESDFCKVGITFDPFIEKHSILVADVSQVAPVFQPVPGKGNFFEEPLAKQGASDRIQIYGQVGLAHAPAFLHGAITGLEVK
jgi:hypothetical protein